MGSFINANITSKESWSFELLGGVSVRSDLHQLEDLVGKKPGALLALLALSPGRTRPREEVIDLIWPEVDFDNARNRFKQTLAALRKQLEPVGVVPGSVLIADRSQVGIAAGHKSDAAEFQQSLRSAAMATEPVARAQHLRAALALYKGEFAPGFYLDVLLTERERLNALAQSARERLAELEATQGTEQTLPAVAAPPVSLHPTNAFFGRQTERDHLAFLLTEHRLITLLGPGGTGKTRLTQELQTAIPHSHFVSLSSLRNGASIPDALVSALALPDSTEPALERLKAPLANTLLVLDNFEQLVVRGGPEALSALLESIPTLRLLITSRLKLNLAAEQVFPLAPLPEDDAVALFCDRARLAHPHFMLTEENSEAVVELCKRLDGLPLAIELAAARAAILTPQQILSRLSRRFDLLADKRRDREERHTSLRVALDWGWSLLAPDVQRFFTQLCIFRGSFSLEAAETVTGEFLAIDYLQSLADGSFLILESGRFRLLETLREYGREKLDREEEERLRKAHFDFFFARANAWRPLLNGAEFSVGMAHYKEEQGNLLAALDRALIADPAQAVELCLKISYFWQCVHWNRPALEYLNQAIALAKREGLPEKTLYRLDHTIGYAYMRVQEYTTARGFYERAYLYDVAQLQEQTRAGAGDEILVPLRRSIAGLLHNLGILCFHEAQVDRAQKYYLEAVEINQAIGNIAWQARNLDGLGGICSQRALESHDAQVRLTLFETALDYIEEAIQLCHRAQEHPLLHHLLQKKTYLLQILHRFTEALPLLHQGFPAACSLETWGVVIGFLSIYYHQALEEQLWEEAAQFQGAVAGLSQRWDTETYLRDDSHLRPRVNLPELLGPERYDFLYQAGFHASLDSLQTLTQCFHQPALPLAQQAQRQ